MTYILGIETSCDETAASVIKNGDTILSNEIFSQIEVHEKYGGVVPEIASRNHLEKIDYIVEQALITADQTLDDIDAIAVTNRPGLVGALLVGVSFAKSLAYAKNLPLIGVNHIEAHLAANYLESDLSFPYIGLVISGGHSHIFKVTDYLEYEVLGRSRDDAVGEAFDKVARSLGLGYPGGPKIDAMAKTGDKTAIDFPRSYFEDSLDFSFSGIKSAVLNYLNTQKMKEIDIQVEDVAASFQDAVTDVLVTNAIKACKEHAIDTMALAGGVASNSQLREKMKEACERENIDLHIPSPILCTDNAAMVAAHGYHLFKEESFDSYDLNAIPSGRL